MNSGTCMQSVSTILRAGVHGPGIDRPRKLSALSSLGIAYKVNLS